MIKTNIYILSIAFGAIFLNIDTYSQFKVDAQLRNRFEFRDGYQKFAVDGSTPAAFISQRSRITLSYSPDNLKLVFTPQDVRLWVGDAVVSSSGVANNTTIGLFEGYAEVPIGNLVH